MNQLLFYFKLKTKHYSQELLNIVLHEGVQSLPAEALREFLSAHGFVRELQLVENSLQGQCYGASAVV